MDSLTAKKSLGQHWLGDAASLRAIADAADVSADDTILEIGPGLGTLTRVLLKRAKQVVAIELDKSLAENLAQNLQEHKTSYLEVVPLSDGKDGVVSNLTVVVGNILRFDLTTLPTGYKVVANIPYYLTSNLIRVLSESANPPIIAALLVQKEVAERVAAKPGQMSLLSVSAQFYWDISLGRIVRAELFSPPPKVDSQILLLKRRSQPLFPDIDPKDFFRIVKAGFAGKRKTLLNTLSAGLQLDKPAILGILERAGIDPKLRAQNLSLEDWHKIIEACSL